jgi:hypothetical protein
MTRRAGARRCCPSHSPTLRPWTAASAVARPVRGVLRGGVLEPGARRRSEIVQAKAAVNQQRHLLRRSARGPFSLRWGLDSS